MCVLVFEKAASPYGYDLVWTMFEFGLITLLNSPFLRVKGRVGLQKRIS